MSTKKSVCFITQTSGFGGTEIHTLFLIKLLLSRGCCMELVCCNHKVYDERVNAFNTDRVKLIYTDLSVNDRGMKAKKHWESLFNKKKLDSQTVIFPKGCNGMGSVDFLKACRNAFKKVCYIEHQEANPMPKKNSKRYIWGLVKGLGIWWYKERFVRKSRSFYADHIVAVSDVVGERLVSDCFCPLSKVSVVQNGVYWQDFKRNSNLSRDIIHKYGICEKGFIFGMVTRLDREKGVDIAIQAFHLLINNKENNPLNLIIAGEGPDIGILRKMIKDLNLDKYVIFTGFMKKPQEVLSLFDVILFPSRKEGIPFGLLEGMAAGCLPIVSNVGGMPEVINNAEVGWLINPEDVNGLYKAMHDASQLDESKIATMRKKVVNRVKMHFNAEESYKKILDLLMLN
jgi:glycosyltransferase involved in cell wall biosynthesis